jgi:hypothetical protein
MFQSCGVLGGCQLRMYSTISESLTRAFKARIISRDRRRYQN